MTPYRSASIAGYAAGSLRSLVAVPTDTSQFTMAGAAAGAAALIGWAFGSANVALLWIVGLAMLLDLVAGAVRAVVDPLQHFDVHKLYGGFVGKFFRAILIPAASLIDWLFIASPLPLPEGYSEAFPVTAIAMVGLAAAEITSVLAKLRDGGVAPALIAEVMRHLDRTKLGQEPPARRDYDVAAIVSEKERLRADDPPNPAGL